MSDHRRDQINVLREIVAKLGLEKLFANSPLETRIAQDIQTSREEIARGHYPDANRSLDEYRQYIPKLDEIIMMLINKFELVYVADIGCGTGRAAQEIMNAYKEKVDMIGATLIYHPPVESDAALPSERIYITNGGVPLHPRGPIRLALAVGSLDTNYTFVDTGEHILKLLGQGGVFILAPTTTMTELKMTEIEILIAIAEEMGFLVREYQNNLNRPYFIFIKE